ncbi:hypothetical protein LMG27952_00284 [Paraburkholderia hiiakae]|uniref:DUF7024 domain-containing protein n=1 Tax=Paraburkholderia hiiakae TaxID=1081782 RepID=A0ABN7HD55_9BURK|nr:hypothetical protein [Paraburkholderia hiiakae]CAD6509510.1 hypothetical protein LMG27952_00284 [Paraburkholderia hiiakae]
MQEVSTPPQGLPATRKWKYAIALLIPALIFVFALTRLPPTRVGDGSEYYALYLAWKDTLRPFMTPASWAQYDALVKTGAIDSMVPLRQLVNQFPALRLGATADVNHFWAYSGLAALLSALPAVVSIKLAPHSAFLLTHAVLFALVSVMALRLEGGKGLGGLLLVTFFSPMIWFADKVHTEFFTFCLVLGGVIACGASRFFLATLLLAAASTQNVSFAVVAFIPLLIDLYRRKHRVYSFFELIALALSALLVFLHPAYYFFRYGVFDPQLLAGGAKIGGNLRVAYVWLFDPDIGLFPNWPFGIVLIIYGLIALGKSGAHRERLWNHVFFCVGFLAINLPAQSSTEKLNAGATPDLARYATWYIPLFYPLAVSLVGTFSRMPTVQKALVVILGALCAVFTFTYQRPELSEAGSMFPSPASRLVQTYMPRVYNPPAEIFSKRYGGIGESPALQQAYAILGPDCRKVLLLGGDGPIYGGAGCAFSTHLLVATVKAHAEAVGTQSGGYLHLTDAEANGVKFRCPRIIDFSKQGNLSDSALSGFGFAEDWGRWSDGAHATLACKGSNATSALVSLTAFSPGNRRQNVLISANGADPRLFTLDSTQRTLSIPLPSSADGEITLRFDLPDAISPKEAGVSEDFRKLGIGIQKIEFAK